VGKAEVVRSEQEVDRTYAEHSKKCANSSKNRQRVRGMVQDDGGNKAWRPDISNNIYHIFRKNNGFNQGQGYRYTNGNININNLKFADDTDVLEEVRNKLQENMNEVRKAREAACLKINVGKNETMVMGNKNIKEQIVVEDIKIENVTEFTYLDSLLTYDNDCSKETGRSIGRQQE